MKQNYIIPGPLVIFLMMAGVCVTYRINLKNTGHATIENRSPGKVNILRSDAYEEDGRFRGSGRLKRRDNVAAPIPSHGHVIES